jgi:large subunit ribosomal protein L25
VLRDIKITAQRRDVQGRKASRKLARRRLVPGVLYGRDKPPVTFQFDPRDLEAVLHGAETSTTLFNFGVEGVEEPGVTIIKDLQHDPLSGQLIHADLYRISMDKAIHIRVPINLTGTARGVKEQGGVLDFVCRNIDISCLPAHIPEMIDVDVSELEIGNSIKVGELAVAAEVTVHTDPAAPVATLVAPAAEKAQVAAEEEAAAEPSAEEAEPELIKKGKGEAEDGKTEGEPEKKSDK